MSEPPTRPGATDFRIAEEQQRDGVAVLALHGDADLHVADELKERLRATLDRGLSVLVLDLGGVTFLDSSALGALVGAARHARTAGGELRLVVPRAELRRIFEVTLLDRVLVLEPTLEDALASAGAREGDG